MPTVRRSRFAFFALEDHTVLDPAAFLRGEVRIESSSRLCGISPATAVRRLLTPAELSLLLELSSSHSLPLDAWLADKAPADRDLIQRLAREGFLLMQGEIYDPEIAEANRREEQLTELGWNPNAARYHFATMQEESHSAEVSPELDVEAYAARAEEAASRFVERHGAPPPSFHQRGEMDQAIDLPWENRPGDLYAALEQRRTRRAFDDSRALPHDAFATLVRYVFAAQGECRLAPEVSLLHKTSPSGGSLHPIEVYPMVFDVEGLEPGIYHYNGERHALVPLRSLSPSDGRHLAVKMARQQLYVGNAHVLFLLTARWFRNFWKYRHIARTYGVVLMDAGHLSQTFYLVAAELGLAAFFTGALHAGVFADTLEIDPILESPIGICGCGIPAPSGSPRTDLDFRPIDRAR